MFHVGGVSVKARAFSLCSCWLAAPAAQEDLLDQFIG